MGSFERLGGHDFAAKIIAEIKGGIGGSYLGGTSYFVEMGEREGGIGDGRDGYGNNYKTDSIH